MDGTLTISRTVEPGAPQTLVAVVPVRDGNDPRLAVISDIASVSIKVWVGSTQVTPTLTPAAVDVFYNAPQSGRVWGDADGGNFLVQISGSYFPDGNKVYEVVLTVTLTGGESFVPVRWKIMTVKAAGSC